MAASIEVWVKTYQGVRSLEADFTLVDAGAYRRGATATLEILEEFKKLR